MGIGQQKNNKQQEYCSVPLYLSCKCTIETTTNILPIECISLYAYCLILFMQTGQTHARRIGCRS